MTPTSTNDEPADERPEGELPGAESPKASAEFELPEEFGNDETAQLVSKAQAGDTDALNDLFARYHQIMVEMARRKLGPKLRAKEDPDDLAQTTFREATRDFSRYKYQGQGSLLRWLIQILQNKIRDRAEFYTARKRDLARERNMDAQSSGDDGAGLGFAGMPSEDLSVTRQVTRGESFALLHDALEELTPEHREAITLVFFKGMSLREAGNEMGGKSEDAVRMMLRRAEGKLGDILKRQIGEQGS